MKINYLLLLTILLAACSTQTKPYTLKDQFPEFAKKMDRLDIQNQLLPMSDQAITDLEANLKIQLPPSYKRFLKCTRGFDALAGTVQINSSHPFYHTDGPGKGMLCFAEFFLEGDGDQVLLDIKQKDKNGEYPVYYYAHEGPPPGVRKIAGSFEQWLNEFPDYKELNEE